jgi:hypothetical protein
VERIKWSFEHRTSMRLTAFLLAAVFFAISISLATVLRGYALLDTPKWPDGVIQLTYNLGNQVTYSDGKTPNQVADIAATMWNPLMARVSFSGAEGTPGDSAANNGQNNVFFSTDSRGAAFGPGVLAVALLYEREGKKEADVIVNAGLAWDSFLFYESSPRDLQRVLVHEYGHVLGLGHPDTGGQNVEAVMNSQYGPRFEPALDDYLGIVSLYGEGVGHSRLEVSYQSESMTVNEGVFVNLDVSVTDSTQVTYRWLFNGVPIADENRHYLQFIASLQREGVYECEFTNGYVTVRSKPIKVTVLKAAPPQFVWQPRSLTVSEGRPADFNVNASGKGVSLQWLKNGVEISGETGDYLRFDSVTIADEGVYQVRATNGGGSVLSNEATLTVELVLVPSVSDFLGNELLIQGGDLTRRVYVDDPLAVYQWYKDGEKLHGFFEPELKISNFQISDAGEYGAVVRSFSGTKVGAVSLIETKPPRSGKAVGWVALERCNDIVYVAFASPSRVERYHLLQERWLDPLVFDKSITGFAVDDESLFIAFGKNISTFDLSGQKQQLVITAENEVWNLWASQKWLVVYDGVKNELYVIDREKPGSKPVISNAGASYFFDGIFLESQSTLFSKPTGTGAARKINADGTLLPEELIENGHLTFAGRSAVSPDGLLVASASGGIIDSHDHRLVTTLGSAEDVAFDKSGQLFSLNGGYVHRHDDRFQSSGRWQLSKPGNRLYISGGSAFVFTSGEYTSDPVSCEKIVLAESTLRRMAQAPLLDPNSTPFAISDAVVDDEGNVLLVAPLQRQVYRWSPSERKFLEGYGLAGMPNYFSYQAGKRTLFFGYADGRVSRVFQNDGGEVVVLTNSENPKGLCATDSGFALGLGYVNFYNSDGVETESQNYTAARYSVWNQVQRKIFGLDFGFSAFTATEVTPEGKMGSRVYENNTSIRNLIPPLRVNAEGTRLITGGGEIWDGNTLKQIASLGDHIVDASWLLDQLYSFSRTKAGATIKRWATDYTKVEKSVSLPGTPTRILSLNDGSLLAIHDVSGKVVLTQLDADLAILYSHRAGVVSLPSTPHLQSISSRSRVGKGSDVMIAGFALRGGSDLRLLIRAAGPKLESFGIFDELSDPKVEIFNEKGVKIGSNDSWGSGYFMWKLLKRAFKENGAFAFDDGSQDAALVTDVPPGGYTAVVSGVDERQGVSLVEVYAMSADAPGPQLIGISTRAKVGTGADVLIGGFSIKGKSPKKVLIRGIGPALGAFGVSGVLADPKLTLYSGDKALAQNDNWGGTLELSAAFGSAGTFALSPTSRDSALLTTLEPGNYTAIVEGVDNTTGVALVEIYEVPE